MHGNWTGGQTIPESLFFFRFHVKQFFNKNYSKKSVQSCMVRRRVDRARICCRPGEFTINSQDLIRQNKKEATDEKSV